METKCRCNLDKLKICYQTPLNFWDNLTGQFKEYGGTLDVELYSARLCIIEQTEDTLKVAADVFWEGRFQRLGMFDFTNSGKYRGLAFFTFENKALYTPFYDYPPLYQNPKCNVVPFLHYFAEWLDLEINNITLAEVAVDVPKNITSTIRKYIKDTEHYDMFLNGKLVSEKETLQDYGEFYTRTRKQMAKIPTLYFGQKKQTGLRMKIYNKTEEMGVSSKDYIGGWNDFPEDKVIYRMEATIRNTDLTMFASLRGYEKQQLLDLLCEEGFRWELWEHSTNRLVQFREKPSGRIVAISDMV